MAEKLHIITCSYGPDLERCKRLCASIDQYVPSHIRHTLIVPERDLEAFAPLAGDRRAVLSTESVLPGGFRQITRFRKWWLDGQGWPVRGWILQQLTKMSADRVTDAENLVFADSDIQLIRPFDESAVLRDGHLRLHREPGAKRTGEHLVWHKRAATLLGTPREYAGADYVGQLITWRREHLIGMKLHIEAVTGQPWFQAVGRSLRVSEYILYGVYVDRVLPLGSAGHYGSNEELCHCCWFNEEADALVSGSKQIGIGAVALLLQSNLGLDLRREEEILGVALAQAQTC